MTGQVRLHLNENAFVSDSPVWDEIEPLLIGSNRYPPMDYGELRTAIGRWLSIAPDRVLLGNGSTEIIHRTYFRLGGAAQGDVLFAWPSYVLYRELEQQVGVQARTVPAGDIDALLRAIDERTKLVIVCTPDNPTGRVIATADIARLASQAWPAVVLVDEAYIDYLDGGRERSAVDLCDRHENLLVVGTFSKLYGLAGLRVAYAVGSTVLTHRLGNDFPNWNVNGMAMAAALSVLRHEEWFDRVRRRTRSARADLVDHLQRHFSIHGDEALPFVFATGSMANDFAAHCARHDLLVRDLTDSCGPGYLRISVGAEAENSRLTEELARWHQQLTQVRQS